jgi:integrase
VVFTQTESRAVIAEMKGARRLIAGLLYGSGLRIMEAVRLRIKDLEFSRAEILVRDGKGEQDRVTMLPRALKDRLMHQVIAVRKVHNYDLTRGHGAVHMPYALERKYKDAATNFVWQYVFPAARLSIDPKSGKVGRHHVAEQNVQRAEMNELSREVNRVLPNSSDRHDPISDHDEPKCDR